MARFTSSAIARRPLRAPVTPWKTASFWRMLPEIFRDCRVQRLALFFRTFRDTLRGIAPRNRDNPRIVLLTPGPYNETYFEHAYLARYLGYTLVEGGDLTVRDSRVYLKLLGGLQQVDVISPARRRLLRSAGTARRFVSRRAWTRASGARGNVAVANALGSGLVETPTLMPFLPAICRALFGEDLQLRRSRPGGAAISFAREYVLNHLERLVIKPASAVRALWSDFRRTVRTGTTARARRADSRRPRELRGREQQLPLTTVPVFQGERLEPRHAVLRTYLAASDNGFMMMPGGLTRVTASAETMVVSMQQGGGSKDTWVLSSSPVSSFTLLSSTVKPVELSRGGSDLPSRAADNLFWLGRYAERAEGLVRLLRGILVRSARKIGRRRSARIAVSVAGPGPAFPAAVADARKLSHQPYAEHFVRDVLFDDEKQGSLIADLALAAPGGGHGPRSHFDGHVARSSAA